MLDAPPSALGGIARLTAGQLRSGPSHHHRGHRASCPQPVACPCTHTQCDCHRPGVSPRQLHPCQTSAPPPCSDGEAAVPPILQPSRHHPAAGFAGSSAPTVRKVWLCEKKSVCGPSDFVIGQKYICSMKERWSDTNECDSPWWRVRDAARYVRCGPKQIYSAIRSGRLKAIRLNGRREVRVRREWVDQWLESQMAEEEHRR
jgi:excisionase family DNA binding protein